MHHFDKDLMSREAMVSAQGAKGGRFSKFESALLFFSLFPCSFVPVISR